MARIVLQGSPLSPGIAIAPLVMLRDAFLYEKRFLDDQEIENEIEALNQASEKVCARLEHTMQSLPGNPEYNEIMAAQMELAADPKIIHAAIARMRQRKICAAWALSETIDELCSLFENLDDAYLCDRARDIRAIGEAIGNALPGSKSAPSDIHSGILAGRDLSPADVMELCDIKGIITVEGGATSHTAILARGLKVPAVAEVANLLEEARKGETAIVDGVAGIVLLGPDESDLEAYRRKQEAFHAFEREAARHARQPARTMDGQMIGVCANLDSRSELHTLPGSGAEGIGLYRTEFAFLGPKQPDEEKLVAEYSAVLEGAAPEKVIFRTLDVGADKIPHIRDAQREPNPALGVRGIRFSLKYRDIFRSQLRAILRASHQRNAAIMLPMVTTAWEVDVAKALIRDLERELEEQEVPHARNLPLGIMVETPAAVLISDFLARQCDFLSVGTNDLIHYLMAIDRNNRQVAYLHDPLHPGFLRALKQIVDEAHSHGKKVSVCGELAADPFGIPLLIGLGVDMLSAAPGSVPGIKGVIRGLDSRACAKVAENALTEANMFKTRKELNDMLLNSLGGNLLSHFAILPSHYKL